MYLILLNCILSYPIVSYPIKLYLILLNCILSYQIASYPIQLYLILSNCILSYQIASHPIQLYLIILNCILSYPIASYPIQLYLILSNYILSYQIASYPIQLYLILSNCILSYLKHFSSMLCHVCISFATFSICNLLCHSIPIATIYVSPLLSSYRHFSLLLLLIFHSSPLGKAFSQIRLISTGPQRNGSHSLSLSFIEFYGTFFRIPVIK